MSASGPLADKSHLMFSQQKGNANEACKRYFRRFKLGSILCSVFCFRYVAGFSWFSMVFLLARLRATPRFWLCNSKSTSSGKATMATTKETNNNKEQMCKHHEKRKACKGGTSWVNLPTAGTL